MNRAVWINAVLGERRSWVLGWSAVLLLLFVLAAVFFSIVSAGDPKMQLIGCTVPLALLAMFYWFRYVPGAVRQNSPANARLVPGLHRAVRRTTVLAWCVTLAPLAVFASAFEQAALMFVFLSMFVTSIGMARGGSAVGSVIYILLIMALSFASYLPAGLLAWMSTAPVLAVLFVLSAVFAREGLCAVFPFGGERHWKLLPAQAMQRGSADLQRVMRNRLVAKGFLPYRRLLQRDLRPSARPEHLLLHALGPGNHRFDFVRYLLQLLLLAIVVKLTLAALGLGAAKAPPQLIAMFGMIFIPMLGTNFHRLVVSMRNTRGEQALVRLAPRAPRADQLGPVLARQMLRVCLSEWLAYGAAALAVLLLFGAGAKELVTLAMLQCAALAMVGWPLRDYSGKARGWLAVVIAQAVLVAGLAFGLYMVRDQPALWIALPGCALAIVYQRWKTMAVTAPPFPASAAA